MKSEGKNQLFLSVLILLSLFCVLLMTGTLSLPANAQAQLQSSPDGQILVVPLQISRESYGLAMIDTANQTLLIYDINNRVPIHRRLRLLAARSWKYDRLLSDLNTDLPKPEQVKMMLENWRQEQIQLDNETSMEADANVLQIVEPNGSKVDNK